MELLERETYLAELDDALEAARRGNGRLALVSGEAGVGKTSLIEAFSRRYERTTRVLWGVCDALFTPSLLGPLHDMAVQMDLQISQLLASETAAIEIRTAFLDELQQTPTIAVFEDVHWGDEATLDLVRYVGRRIGATPSLVILTYRDDELGPRHPLRPLLGDLVTAPTTVRCAVQPISLAGVERLAKALDVDPEEIHRRTGGNPFYLTEIISSPETGIPDAVTDVILARAARLSPSAHAVLEAAAVIGHRVEPWLLAAVTGAEMPAVDESLNLGILRSGDKSMQFRHELVRETILGSISSAWRQVLNKLVLQELQASTEGRRDLARLVHHAEAAGDSEAILAYGPQAAQAAAAAGAHRAAALLYGLVIEYAADMPPSDRGALLEARALECLFIDDIDAAIGARRRAIALYRETGNPLKEAENLVYLAMALNGVDRWTEAAETREAAIRLLETLPPGKELVVAYRSQALSLINNHEPVAARALAEKAANLAEGLDDDRILAMALDTLGSVTLEFDYEGGRQIILRALRIAMDAGLDARVATLYANLGSVSCDLYRLPEAERYLGEGLAFTADRDLEMLRMYMLAWQSCTFLHLGRWWDAEMTAAEVLKWPKLSSQSLLPALVVLGRLAGRRGRVDPARFLDQALEVAKASGHFQHLAQAIAARTEAWLLSGQPKLAIAESEAIYDQALEKQNPWFAGEVAYLRKKAGEEVAVFEWMARPYLLQLTGNWEAAAEEWARLGCPYEEARALAEGNAAAQIRAVEIFDRLGAQVDAGTLRAGLKAAGVVNVPARPRADTKQNPFGLTNRQLEILVQLMEGVTNAEIAARLFISQKTVDHHVSAILAKMEVPSRQEAAAEARRHPYFESK